MADMPGGNLGERQGSMRSRLVFLVTLPVIVLGTSYFLFVEYVLQDQWLPETGPWVALRVGGVFLIVIAVLVAVTCGFLVVDRVTRPVRLLLRLVESGELESGGGVFLHHREWEIFQLYRRIHALVLQNRSAAEAATRLRELEEALHALLQDMERPSTHGVPPHISPQEGTPDETVRSLIDRLSLHRARLLDYLADLTVQASEIRTRVGELEVALGDASVGMRRAAKTVEDAVSAFDAAAAFSAAAPPRHASSNGEAGRTGSEDSTDNGHPDARPAIQVPATRTAPSATGSDGWRAADALVAADAEELVEEVERAFGSLERVRQLGVVAALEAERSGASESRRVGDIFERFQSGVGDLERALDAWVAASLAERPQVDERAEAAIEQVALAQTALEREADRSARLVSAVSSLETADLSRLEDACRRVQESLARLERRLAEVDAP